jgi:pyruvate dehydrogenase (quinone)
MTKKVADLLMDVLAEVGVWRIYGVVGDSLNGITDSIRVKNNLEGCT